MLKYSTISVHTYAPLIQYLLTAWAAILIHYHRILLRRIKISRLYHPAVQHHALGCCKLEHFLLTQIISSQLLLQVMIVYQCGQHLTVVLTDGILSRIVDVAPDIDEVLVVLTEYSAVHTSLWCQHLYLSVLMSYQHLLLGSAIWICSKICIARLLIETIYSLYYIFLVYYLSQLLTVQIVEIQMIVAITLAGQ